MAASPGKRLCLGTRSRRVSCPGRWRSSRAWTRFSSRSRSTNVVGSAITEEHAPPHAGASPRLPAHCRLAGAEDPARPAVVHRSLSPTASQRRTLFLPSGGIPLPPRSARRGVRRADEPGAFPRGRVHVCTCGIQNCCFGMAVALFLCEKGVLPFLRGELIPQCR